MLAEVKVRPEASVEVINDTLVRVTEEERVTAAVALDEATLALIDEACCPSTAAADVPTSVATFPLLSVNVTIPPAFNTEACDWSAAICDTTEGAGVA